MDKNSEQGVKGVDWTQVPWEAIVPQLLSYARKLLHARGWRGHAPGGFPPHMTAEDIVQSAVMKTISGDRNWSKSVNLFDHLRGVIKSDISHLVNSNENRSLRSIDTAVFEKRPSHEIGPEQELLEYSERKSFFGYLRERDPILEKLAHLMIEDGVFSLSELSDRLGKSNSSINNLKKRLRRVIASYQREQVEIR